MDSVRDLLINSQCSQGISYKSTRTMTLKHFLLRKIRFVDGKRISGRCQCMICVRGERVYIWKQNSITLYGVVVYGKLLKTSWTRRDSNAILHLHIRLWSSRRSVLWCLIQDYEYRVTWTSSQTVHVVDPDLTNFPPYSHKSKYMLIWRAYDMALSKRVMHSRTFNAASIR